MHTKYIKTDVQVLNGHTTDKCSLVIINQHRHGFTNMDVKVTAHRSVQQNGGQACMRQIVVSRVHDSEVE